MGILTIEIGQCGNQIGHTLFNYLANDINSGKLQTDYNDLSKDLWFSDYKNSKYIPRSILIDTENKVVSSIIHSNGLIKYKNIIAKTGGGSANNWAYGYTFKAEQIIEEVVETTRKEIENSDDITYILSIFSSGGGTGSGTSSRVLEALRNEFPKKIFLNIIVLPYKNGDIVTQNYNTLLTLAELYDITDGSIIFENDLLHKTCDTLLSIKNVDLTHINKLIAQKIASVFQPTENYSLFPDFVNILTPHPNLKFVQIKTTPHIPADSIKFETLPTWLSLTGNLRQLVKNYNPNMQPVTQSCVTVGSVLISRGGVSPNQNDIKSFYDNQVNTSWILEKDRLKHYHQPRNLFETSRFLTLATNNNSMCNSLDGIIDRAWVLFNNKAFLHQYTKYGLTEFDFKAAFEKVESILQNYKKM